jgi:threonine dehydrogenase-like Zn-dependent dehydrogenase
MQSGLVDLDSMIDCIYPLDDALTAFEYAAGRGILKVLLSRSS